MAEKSKLFDYNTSFLVTRTNPLLTGNIKITVDSSGGAFLNSIDANPALSSDRFKNYKISGKNSYATDLYEFLDKGEVKPETLFNVSEKTDGSIKSSDEFAMQYDFFYCSGATTLIDKNFREPFSYFAPIWLRDEIPEFFVIFKTPGPLSYPYSTNVESGNLKSGDKYKVIQDVDSEEDFVIWYGKDSLGGIIKYSNNDFFKSTELDGNAYTVISGTGKVTLMEELKFQDNVEDVENYFSDKILNASSIVETFDLREGTLIGDYIRTIVNNKSYTNGPIDFNFAENSYSYYHGVDYRNGIYSKSGELLHDYLVSTDSTPMIGFEGYVTSGFARNGIISTNMLNLEFAFDDETSDLYTINRYFGMYVSRNDLGSFKANGNLYYNEATKEGNNNTPKPKRDNIGYYYNDNTYKVESETGVRLYYESANGWIPGSNDVNLNDSNKLYYVSDKNDKLYSLKRNELYSGENADDNYGIYDTNTASFGLTGSTGATAGNFVISNKTTDLNNFTGIDSFSSSVPIIATGEKGHSYIDVEFNKIYDLPRSIVFKFYWSGGASIESGRRYDLIYSGDYSGILPWIKGSFYNFGDSRVFNPYDGEPKDIANSFSSLVRDFAGVRVDSGNAGGVSIIRAKIPGKNSNGDFSISVFYDYTYFESRYLGLLDPDIVYNEDDIVIDAGDNYLIRKSGNWEEYKTFNSTSGYGSIAGIDFSDITSNMEFIGGTDHINGRFAFSNTTSDIIKADNWVQTYNGKSRISNITRFVDSPVFNDEGTDIIGFKNLELLSIANLENPSDILKLGGDSKVSVFTSSSLKVGVFTFFDVKEFDYDFWTSEYAKTPIAEANRYYYLKPDEPGNIKDQIPYYIKKGGIEYNGTNYNEGILFMGSAARDYFTDLKKSGISAVVIPSPFTQVTYNTSFPVGSTAGIHVGTDIKYEDNLDSFSGFYGIEAIDDGTSEVDNNDKESLFAFGSLNTEYEYLQENYNIETSNISRIVPYINKWSLFGGTDARGNPYRLNSSPAFSPTNFSPSLDRDFADPAYLTHEGFILESLPREYQVNEVNNQKNYLPESPDYHLIKNADPNNASYFDEFFTVASLDYPGIYSNDTGATKEFFGTFTYNEASGFYNIVFRGIKYILKRKSAIAGLLNEEDPGNIANYRGFNGYKFTSILRVILEDPIQIQAPVKHEIIENTTQKSIVFLTTVVINDYRIKELVEFPDDTAVIDYTLLYSLSDKKKLNIQANGNYLNAIDDIKLSVGLDLSYSSGSYVNDVISPGRIYAIDNPEYDTDLREEIKLTYAEGSNKTSTSEGSFYVPQNSSDYPWSIEVAKDFIEFGKLDGSYTFNLPFLGATSGITIPAGSAALYKGKPVFQRGGGTEYYNDITSRISMGQIADKINLNDPYIEYRTYSWNEELQETVEIANQFSINIEPPAYYQKQSGPYPYPVLKGPQIIGESQITSYTIEESTNLKTDLLRFGGFYEPLFNKIIKFKDDKDDTISGDPTYDLSFRNATFGPSKDGFGKMYNLNYTKVSLDKDILSATNDIPEGPVYPLIGETPIDQKDFSIFYSSWDPGYYDLYNTATDSSSVAGTRAMKENKSFFGSKIMKTPDRIRVNNFIGMEVSKTEGSTDINAINKLGKNALKDIQNMEQTQNADGTGQLPKAFIGVDLEKMDENIYPDVEFFWQNIIDPFKDDNLLYVNGVIRIDRMLRRYLLNSGVEKDFVNNMISEYGIGNPESIEDDILKYVDLNILPIYESNSVDFYMKTEGTEFDESKLTVRGDIIPAARSRTGFINTKEFSVTKRSSMVYEFSYKVNPAKYYSMNFNFDINKI